MPRTLPPGAVKLDRDQRRDLKVLIARLGLQQKDIADSIEMNAATLSSAVREDGNRAFSEAQFEGLRVLVQGAYVGKESGEPPQVRDELKRLVESVFPSQNIQAAAIEVGPGEPMGLGATSYVARHHDIFVRMSRNPKPLRFFIGAPMTGKTAALLRLQKEVDLAGQEVEYFDFAADAKRQKADATPVENPTAHLLNIIQTVVTGEPSSYRSVPKGMESRFFCNALRDGLLRKYRGREVLIILDHVHMFADDPRFWDAMREFPLAISAANMVNVHFVVADDGTCIETAFQSQTYARGNPLQFGHFDEENIEALVQQAVGRDVELDHDHLHDGRRRLGDIAFLHHLAVAWAAEDIQPKRQGNGKVAAFSKEYLNKCNDIVDLLATLDQHSAQVRTNSGQTLLVSFRRRVLNSLLRPRLQGNLDARQVLGKLAKASSAGQMLAEVALPNSYAVPITWAGLAQLNLAIPAYFSAIARWGYESYEQLVVSEGSG